MPGQAVGTSLASCDRVSMSSTDDMAALAAGYPGWHVWRARSRSGALTGWHATATRALRHLGVPGRLSARDAPGLRALLGQQEALRRRGAA